VRAVRRLRDALHQADFVVLSTEPGPIEMRYADLEIPARYGILQTVGDTVGPGGLLRALRSIEVYDQFAQLIAEYCPRAWVINYTNPMTLCTAALQTGAADLKVFGCCHAVFETQAQLAGLVGKWFEVPGPPRHEIKVDVTGLNHFTWITAASWRGHDLLRILRDEIAMPGFFRSRANEARAAVRAEHWFKSPGLVGYDFFRRFGALGAAPDRHLVEFVPWYLTSEAELHRWGVVATPYAWRRRRVAAADFPVAHYAARGAGPE